MSSTHQQPKFRLAIAGGGIAGLALAAALTKSCHEQLAVTVYEAVPEYKDVGAGLALHLNAIKAMALLGPALQRAYFERALTMAAEEDTEMATTVILAQGPHAGTTVAELGRAKGRKTIARSDLVERFLELVPAGTVRFGKRLVAISEEEEAANGDDGVVVKLSFKDGTTAEADALIGADGIHSVTRRYLLGAEHPAAEPKNHDGWVIYRTLVVPIMLGPRGHINCIPLRKNTRLSAGVAVRGSVFTSSSSSPDEGDDPQQSKSKPKLDPSLYADYTEEAQQIVRLVAADTSASWTAADHDHAPTYARGRVCLLGDAAHASLPFAGNGAAQALEDAAVLHALFSSSLSSGNLHDPGATLVEKMFEAYDAVRRPRSQAVVDLARRFGRVYAYAEDGMHEDPVRMKAFFAEMGAFTNQFDVRGQNEEAVRVFQGLMMGRKCDGNDGQGRTELPN
ncbi:FAD/NAD(P)-binding domain-containing protein [Apiospora phragmitis]|uniref:FAD/NAD(P)-binding domain-containing protein n=1 Tax=Apiospora phragmitis TaxID=2905665 RepID=A0ABR1VE54_9PEZI